MSDTVTATRFMSWTILRYSMTQNSITQLFSSVSLMFTHWTLAFIKVLFVNVRYRNCIITLKTGVKRMVNRWDVFQKFIEIDRPTGYNSSGSFTVEWTSLTSFFSKVNFRQLTVTKMYLNFTTRGLSFSYWAKSTFCNVQNNAVFIAVM